MLKAVWLQVGVLTLTYTLNLGKWGDATLYIASVVEVAPSPGARVDSEAIRTTTIFLIVLEIVISNLELFILV